MRILVTGVTGQLGYDVVSCLKERQLECIGTGSSDFDLADADAVREYLMQYRPDIVIHCAAYTNVNQAQQEQERCRAVNVDGTRAIALACRELGAGMVYISTDYVFPGDGTQFYETDDSKNPQCVYGRTKYEGEQAVQEILEKYFIVRVSWTFGAHGNNFVKTMLRLGRERQEVRVVDDQVGSPSYTKDIAAVLCDIAVSEKYGVYHLTNEGVCSWAEFTQEIFRQAGIGAKVIPIPSSEYPTPAKRPLNSRLSKRCLDEAGFARLPQWQDALARFLKELS